MLIDVSSLVRRPAHRQRLLRDEASSLSTTGSTLMLAPLPRLADDAADDAANDNSDDIVDEDSDPDATTEDEPVSDVPVIVTWCD